MSNFKDLTGQKFGRLTVIKRIKNNKYSKAQWLCECECGNKIIVISSSLIRGNTKSCGCLQKEKTSNTNKSHGLSGTKLYKHWLVMRRRCNDKKFSRYKWYGGRGIKVCEEWSNKNDGFINFYNWSLKNSYKEGLSIDRIDVNGDYEPSNCRWTTIKEQSNNKQNNHYITYNGKTQSMMKWCEELNLNYNAIKNRLNKYHWNVKEAFEIPIRNKRGNNV